MERSDNTVSRPFELTAGGPTYRLERRVGLIQERSPLVVRTAVLTIFLTWIPLLVLSALQGTATGNRVPVPFLRDFAVHGRFLLAVPLLVVAETIIGPHLAHAARHFVDSGLVSAKDFANYDAAVEKGLRWRDSTVVEVVLVLLAYGITALNLISMAVHVSTWYAFRTESGISLSWSGWWFVLFCVPLFQFLTLRWIWRQFLWGQFLWRMNRLDLQLTPTHPDQAGGLAFTGEVQRYFSVILLAYSFAAAGVLANEVIYDRTPLPHFAAAVAVYVIASVGIVLAPLAVFTGRLLKTKRSGLFEYSTLATTYTQAFHKKWILKEVPQEEAVLGTADIQSLADLGNSFAFIDRMNALPMAPRTPIHLALASLLPMAPLLLTVMPLGELMKMVFKVVG